MKNIFKVGTILFFIIIICSCVTTQKKKNDFSIVLDPMFNDSSVFKEGWLIYASKIKEDMEKFYQKNPKGKYTIPYTVENGARRFMMFFYAVSKQKNSEINDNYLEDLIKINAAGLFDEYIYICFHPGHKDKRFWDNPGNWTTDKELQIEYFGEWMSSNLNDHIPLTLVYVVKK